jgi:hypothetical protein
MPAESSIDDLARSHRWHACECNNAAWTLAELSSRSAEQDDEMLNAAHAAAFHWSKVGNELNAARASMLLGHVHAALGHGATAMRYARESFDYLVAHDPPDWELAFAHAILAHAAAAAGETGLHREHFAQAEQLGKAIADSEDREIFFKTFLTIPKPAN